MPELHPKNPLSAQYIETYLKDQTFTTAPAYSRYVGDFETHPHEYTTDPDAVGIVSAAVEITFEDGTVIFLDTDEVSL